MSNTISEFTTLILLPPFLGVAFYFMYSVFLNIILNRFIRGNVIFFKEIFHEVLLIFTIALGLTLLKTLYVFTFSDQNSLLYLDQLQNILFPPFLNKVGYVLLFLIPLLNVYLLVMKKPVNRLVRITSIFVLAYFMSRFGIIY